MLTDLRFLVREFGVLYIPHFLAVMTAIGLTINALMVFEHLFKVDMLINFLLGLLMFLGVVWILYLSRAGEILSRMLDIVGPNKWFGLVCGLAIHCYRVVFLHSKDNELPIGLGLLALWVLSFMLLFVDPINRKEMAMATLGVAFQDFANIYCLPGHIVLVKNSIFKNVFIILPSLPALLYAVFNPNNERIYKLLLEQMEPSGERMPLLPIGGMPLSAAHSLRNRDWVN